jgi:CubicO group peptidase (beta-lactamase class C family)
MKPISIFSFVFLLGCHCVYAQDLGEIKNEKFDRLLKGLNNVHGPGYAIAVVRKNSVVFKKGYGEANLQYSKSITSESVFDAASLAKQFTGYAISILVQRGQIMLSDDIRKYLPQVPKFGKTITISNLLYHTSGIRDWPEALQMAGWKYEELCSFSDIMNMVKHQRDLDFVPGTSFSYSNTGYNLLAAAIEKITGQPFPEWVKENILKPLKMSSSKFIYNQTDVIYHEASPYQQNEQGDYIKMQNVLTAYGSSSLFTNIDDLCKWIIYLQKGISSNDPIIRRMQEVGYLDDHTNTYYGFGLEIKQNQGIKTISHTGAWSGFRSIVKIYPDQELAYVVLSNGNNDHLIPTLSLRLDDLLINGSDKSSISSKQTERAGLNVDTAQLNQYVGRYKWGTGEIKFTNEDGQLYVQYTGEDKYPTEALSDSTFLWSVAGLPITFSRPGKGKLQSFLFKSIEGTKYLPFFPTPAQVKSYEGTYYSEELSTQYTIDVVNGKLYVHHFRRGDFDLSPETRDTFSSDIGTLHFIKNDKGLINGFKLSGSKVRNMNFAKVSL